MDKVEIYPKPTFIPLESNIRIGFLLHFKSNKVIRGLALKKKHLTLIRKSNASLLKHRPEIV